MQVFNSIAAISTAVGTATFDQARVQHMVVAGEQPFPRPLPLIDTGDDQVPRWLAEFHTTAPRPPAVALHCHFIRDLILVGHDTPFIDDTLLGGPDAMPVYRSNLVQNDHRDLVAAARALPVKVIDEPCFPIAADGNVYGHFLIEAIPRLHIVRRTLAGELPPFKVLVVRTLPAWARTIMRDHYGVRPEDLIEYDPGSEQVLLRQAIWPSLTVQQDYFHPFNNQVIGELLQDVGGGRRLCLDRVFLSRVLFANPLMQERNIGNELELAGIASREFGFIPISPELLSWADQIRLFSEIRHVVGVFGSGLHNALFARRSCRVGVIGFKNLVQTSISALRQQHLAYQMVGEEHGAQLDTDRFRRLLASIT